MSRPETVADVLAEMRRMMPNACGDWADRIERAARPAPDTLRDWFAGQALVGVGQEYLHRNGFHGDTLFPNLATHAYRIADAMLAARARGDDA